MRLSEFLATKPVLFLDGATGTELARRGVDIALPLWSANALVRAPFIVRNIHFFYLNAGADILTTNTFRTNIRTLRRAGMADRHEELTLKAVEFAFEARDRYREARPVLIAGGLAPVEDCYRPDLVPSDAELRDEHGMQAEMLAKAGTDFLLAETMNTAREARIAAEACAATGSEFAISFICQRDGRLLSGESLDAAVAGIIDTRPAALLINCVSARAMHQPLRLLLETSPVPAGCYANVGSPVSGESPIAHEVDIEQYADAAVSWQNIGARIIGGCCGTSPEHIAEVVRRIAPPPSDYQVIP